MDYITKVNEIKDEYADLIDAEEIKNLDREITLKVIKSDIAAYPSTNDCPICSVIKRVASGEEISTDQVDLELPNTIDVVIKIVDYSTIDVTDAERLTDDLINKVLTALSSDPGLSGKVKGTSVREISFNEDREGGVFYSIPIIIVSATGIDLETPIPEEDD